MGMAAAVAGAAVVGAGATMYSTSKASKAANKAADAQTQAAAAANAEQAREFDQIQANNAPFRQIGLSAAQSLAGGFGLPVSMTSAPAAANTNTNVSGLSMTGTGGVGAGTNVTIGANGQPTYTPNTGGVSMTAGQADQILAQRPDVASSQWLASIDPSVIGDRTGDGQVTQADRAAYWYDNYGKAAGMTLPAAQPATLPAAPDTTPAGYADPTAPSGYTVGARPTDYGTQPTYTAPAALNVGLDAYQQSPDFQFRLQQGQAALDHIASAGGGLMSGARVKAAERYNQDYATTDYNNWRDYTTGQYNNDRAFGYNSYLGDLGQYNTNRNVSNGLYQDDRNYAAGRYDTRNNQLMQLAGFGTAANSSDNAAAQSYAANVGSNLMTSGNAQANGYINSANATTGAVNNLMTLGSNLAGRYIGSGAGGFGSNGGYGGFAGGIASSLPSGYDTVKWG